MRAVASKTKKSTKRDLHLITHRSTSLFYPVRNFDLTASNLDFSAFRPNMLAKCFVGFIISLYLCQFRSHELSQLVEALRYKSEVRCFDSRYYHLNFSLTQCFRLHLGLSVDTASKISEYQNYFLGVQEAGE
jgi:hypothetical protein